MMDGVPSFRGLPFFQTQGLQPLAQGAADPPCGPFSRPGSACAHGPLQLQADAGREHFFQALKEEPLFKRLHSECAALPGGEGSLLSLPFPRKHWTIVNCHHFMSSWWEEDGTCVGINEEFFETMERVGSNKLFKTDCMKSFVCQLSLYRFSKAHQDVLTSLCLTTLLREKPPVCVLSKVRAGEYLLGPGGRVGANLRAARDRGRPAGKGVCKDRTGDQHDCQSCQCCGLCWGVLRGRS